MRGDLETIVLKALAKDPDRRYASVLDLGEDLRRFMDKEPIRARRPSRIYVLGKAISRNKGPVLVGLVALAFLAVWAWNELQPPFDKDLARANLLGLRQQFFLTYSTNPVNRHSALVAPEKYPGLPEADLVKALALCATGENGLALNFLNDRLISEPQQWLYRALGSEIGVVKDPTVAQDFSEWATAGEGRSLAESWYLRTFTTMDLKKALAWSHIALTHDPDHTLALENVARLSAMTGDLEISLAAVTKLMEKEKHRDYSFLTLKCNLLCRLGRPEEALIEIDKIEQKEPISTRNHVARAQIHRWLGDYEAAVEDYTRAIALAEDSRQASSWYYYHRGTPQWILGRPEQAAADFRQSFRGLARTTYGNVRLVLVLHELGRKQEALDALAAARLHADGDEWLAEILACLAGEITPEQLLGSARQGNRQKLCEGLYYAGEVYLLNGDVNQARKVLQACVNLGLTTDQGNFRDRLSEFELAEWRLSQFADGSRLTSHPETDGAQE